MLVPRLVDAVRSGRPIDLQGHDGMRINPVHALDVGRAIVAALELDGFSRINVAGPEILSLREIGEIIGRQARCEPVFAVDETQQPRHFVADIRRMKARLVPPERRFEDAVGDLLS